MMAGSTRRRTRLLAAVALALALPAGCAQGDDGLAEPGQGYISGSGAIREIPAGERGEPVEVAGTTAEGETIDIADLRGSVVVLNVWYADCPPCRKEAPVLQAVSEDYAGAGVRFVGLNTRNDSAEAVGAFQDSFGITYPSIRDTDGSALLALRGRGVAPNATPTTVILDEQGRVAASVAGEVERTTLTDLLDRVLGTEGPPAQAAGAAG